MPETFADLTLRSARVEFNQAICEIVKKHGLTLWRADRHRRAVLAELSEVANPRGKARRSTVARAAVGQCRFSEHY